MAAGDFTYPLVFQAGAARTGQAANVIAQVFDNAAAQQGANITASWVESTDAAGNAVTGIYRNSTTLNTSWLNARIKYTITGQAGVAAEEVVTLAQATGLSTLETTLPTTPTANTVGEALYYSAQRFGRRNTPQAGSAGTITLDAGASANDGAYVQHLIKISSGAGAGQFRTITGYVGSTKVATVAPNWSTAPDNTSAFWIEPYPQMLLIAAQSFTNATKNAATLAAGDVSGNLPSDVLAWGGDATAIATDGNHLPKVDVEGWHSAAVTTAVPTSTYSGADTPGTTTLLGRLSGGRAANLDNLDTAISGIAAAVWAASTRTLSSFGTLAADAATAVWNAVARTITGATQAIPTTSAGVGAFAVSVKVSSDGTTPIVGAAVRLGGTAQPFTATSDSGGMAAFSLDAGTYELSITAPGYSFVPLPQVIAAASTIVVTLAPVVVMPASDPGQTIGFLTTRNGQGNAIGGVTLTFSLVDAQAGTDSFDQAPFTATSDSNGLLQVALRRSTVYQGRAENGPWVQFTTGAATTFALPEIQGPYDGAP